MEIKKELSESIVNGEKDDNMEIEEKARITGKPEDVGAVIPEELSGGKGRISFRWHTNKAKCFINLRRRKKI